MKTLALILVGLLLIGGCCPLVEQHINVTNGTGNAAGQGADPPEITPQTIDPVARLKVTAGLAPGAEVTIPVPPAPQTEP